MTYLRKSIATVLLALTVVCATRAADTPITHVANEDIIAWIAVPNLPEALRHSEAAAETFAGKPVPIIDQIASHFGDPALAQIRADAPTVIFVIASKVSVGTPLYVSYLPVKDGAMYQSMAETVGQKTALFENMLVLSQTDEGANRGQELYAAYQDIAAAGITHDARIYASMSKIMTTWGPMLRMGATTLANMAAMQGQKGQDPMMIANLLRLECNVLFELMDQSEESQLDLSWDADTLNEHWEFSAKPGSDLAAALSAPASGPNPALALLGGNAGTFAMSARWNANGIRALVNGILAKLAQDPATKTLVTPVSEQITDMVAGFTGDFASTFNLLEEQGGLQGATSIASKEVGAKYLDALQAMMIDGELGKLYQSMGIRCELKRSVRSHAGVDVNQFSMDTSGSAMKPEEIAMMSSLTNQQMAFTDHWLLIATDDATIDALIDRANAGATTPTMTLKAQKAHGDQAHFHLDYDIAALLNQFMAAAMPADNQPQPAASESDPVTVATTFANGSCASDMRVPFKPIADLVQSMEKQRKERRAQRRQQAAQQQQQQEQEQEAPAEPSKAPEPDVTF